MQECGTNNTSNLSGRKGEEKKKKKKRKHTVEKNIIKKNPSVGLDI